MIAFLIVINLLASILIFLVHIRLATPPDNESPPHKPLNSYEERSSNSHHYKNNTNRGATVPFVSEEHFFESYSKYKGSLPVLKRSMRLTPPKLCGEHPDYFTFFRLPKSQRSRFFEDKIIYDTFFKPNLKSIKTEAPQYGTYVELGAFDGREESNTIFFDNCLGWDGLLIEANSQSYQKVIENRPNAVKMSFSPTCNDTNQGGKQQTALFYNYPLSNNGMKGLAHSYAGKDTVEIPCGPFTPVLLDIFGPTPISFLSLDVEGAETLVLDTIDFSKVHIDVIMIEIQNSYCPNPMSCPQTHMIRKRMAEANYHLFAELVEASDVYAKHGTEAWRRGKVVNDENAKRQWIIKRKMLLEKKRVASSNISN
jgi:FkbM family methyltransferase